MGTKEIQQKDIKEAKKKIKKKIKKLKAEKRENTQ